MLKKYQKSKSKKESITVYHHLKSVSIILILIFEKFINIFDYLYDY